MKNGIKADLVLQNGFVIRWINNVTVPKPSR